MPIYSYVYRVAPVQTISPNQRVKNILIHALVSSFSLFLVLLTTFLINNYSHNYATPISAETQLDDFLATKQFSTPITSPSPYFTPTPYQLVNGRGQDGNTDISPSPTPASYRLTRNFYTVAIIGDSMVDTMGEVLEYLDASLKKRYPETQFLLYNYGTGAQTIQNGLNRFASPFVYQSRDYPSLPELKPDILIVASFAYNPFTPHDRDRHWLSLTELVKQAQSVSSRVYLLAEIAPLRADFGKGPQGVNWSDQTNIEHSGKIIEQLQNTVGLSSVLNVPLIDVFTPSLNPGTQEGKREYVNPSDGIHPSVAGHKFIADKIAQTLILP